LLKIEKRINLFGALFLLGAIPAFRTRYFKVFGGAAKPRRQKP